MASATEKDKAEVGGRACGGRGKHQVRITDLDRVVREDLNAEATSEEICGQV